MTETPEMPSSSGPRWQEVTLGQVIFGLAVVALLVWLSVWVVRLIFPIAVHFAGVLVAYYLGKHIWRQVTSHGLTQRTRLALGISLIVAGLLVVLAAKSLSIRSVMSWLVLFGTCYVLIATAALEVSGHSAVVAQIRRRAQIGDTEERLVAQRDSLEAKIEVLNREITTQIDQNPALRTMNDMRTRLDAARRETPECEELIEALKSTYSGEPTEDLRAEVERVDAELKDPRRGREDRRLLVTQNYLRYAIAMRDSAVWESALEGKRSKLRELKEELKRVALAISETTQRKEELMRQGDRAGRTPFSDLRQDMRGDAARFGRVCRRGLATAYRSFLRLTGLWGKRTS